MDNKKNYELERIVEIFSDSKRGRVLDLGCGDGDYSNRLKNLGFDVIAGDIDNKRFRYHDKIEFKHCDITKKLSFDDSYFDYVLLLEVIEHLKNPYAVLSEINRIIKSNGSLIISTPNVLNLKSRLRFLFEGSYDYFREPPLDQVNNPKEVIFNLHIAPYRYHELEYLLSCCNFRVSDIFTSVCKDYWLGFLVPMIKFQVWQKQKRSIRKNGLDFSRINKILHSKELLFGKHLIIKADKVS